MDTIHHEQVLLDFFRVMAHAERVRIAALRSSGLVTEENTT